MNRYFIISRLRWPALLLLTGVIALLDQANILSWGRAWPLYLILLGVLALAERATLASEPPPPIAAYPYGTAYPGEGYPPAGYPPPGYPAAGYPPQASQGPYPQQPSSAPSASTAPAPGTGIVPSERGLELRSNELASNREEEER
jgi:hypothetical protein